MASDPERERDFHRLRAVVVDLRRILPHAMIGGRVAVPGNTNRLPIVEISLSMQVDLAEDLVERLREAVGEHA